MILLILLGHAEEESWIYRIHKIGGYSTLVFSSLNSAIGWKILSDYEKGKTPPENLRKFHKFLGYTTVTLSITTSTFGYINFWKLWKDEEWRKKRIIHGILSTLSTSAFVASGILARSGNYNLHRLASLSATGGTILAVLWIIW